MKLTNCRFRSWLATNACYVRILLAMATLRIVQHCHHHSHDNKSSPSPLTGRFTAVGQIRFVWLFSFNEVCSKKNHNIVNPCTLGSCLIHRVLVCPQIVEELWKEYKCEIACYKSYRHSHTFQFELIMVSIKSSDLYLLRLVPVALSLVASLLVIIVASFLAYVLFCYTNFNALISSNFTVFSPYIFEKENNGRKPRFLLLTILQS